MVEEVCNLLPERLQPVLGEPVLGRNFEVTGPFLNFLTYQWPYETYARTWDVSAEKMKDVCLQTLREGFYILHVGSYTKQRYLEEEMIRIESGMYPAPIASSLEKLHSRLQDALKKDEEEYQVGEADMEATTICRYLIAPFAVREYVDKINEGVAPGKEISYQPLSESEKTQLRLLLSGEYRLAEMIAFLESRYVDLNRQMANIKETRELRGKVYKGLEFAHIFVTTLHNMLSQFRYVRNINKGAQPLRRRGGFLQRRREVVKADLDATIGESDPEFLDALFAPTESLYSLQYAIAQERAGRWRRRRTA